MIKSWDLTDSHIYSYYASLLQECYEKALEDSKLVESVIAFRSLGKSNINFAYDAFSIIKNKKNCKVLTCDVTGFFDNLDHSLLKKSIQKILGSETTLSKDWYAVFRSITAFSKVDRDSVYKYFNIPKNTSNSKLKRICTTKEFRDALKKDFIKIEKNNLNKGIPQGSPISAILSNVYMFDFDLILNELAKNHDGMYYRYCDDIFFIFSSNATLYEIELKISTLISDIKLALNPDKTTRNVFSINNQTGKVQTDIPLQYLGFMFNGDKTWIRPTSISSFSKKMRKGVSLAIATMIKQNKHRALQGKPTVGLYKRKLFAKYSHLGQRNFISYALRASSVMQDSTIKKQIKPYWKKLIKRIPKVD